MTGHDRHVPDWLNVSRETLDALRELEALVVKWTATVNLISRASIPTVWERHILDSAQLAQLAGRGGATWADLGSGGGFPALVLAVMARDDLPDRRFTLVESDARKAAFLMQAVRSLGLNAVVLVQRIDIVAPLNSDILSARALAPLIELLGHGQRHLAKQGRAFFPKGARFQEEIDEARKAWRFDLALHPSRTDPQAAILEVSNIGIH